jgi:hypothetical protein
MEETRIRYPADDAEGNQGHRMSMDDGSQVWPNAVDGLVKRQFRGGRVMAFHRAVFAYANNVVPSQAALVDAGGCDPDISVCISNRKVAAGGGGHPIPIDAIHHLYQSITWMKKAHS